MRIRLLTDAAVGGGGMVYVYHKGISYDVPEEMARSLLNAKFAEEDKMIDASPEIKKRKKK